MMKENASKKIKNQFLLKKGSYSLAITAAVIIGAIIVNILTSALSDRFIMEYDMTKDKSYSMSKQNIEFIKSIEDEVTITVLGSDSPDEYAYYTGYWAEQSHGIYDENAADYYAQTVRLLGKYDDYNKKVKVEFLDPAVDDITVITSKYPEETDLAYGDIIVSTGSGDSEKHKVVGFEDVYDLYEDNTYASYGDEYIFYTVMGNNLETALAGGISFVLNGENKTVALYTGHSATDSYANTYKDLLVQNGYEVEVVSDKTITSIPEKYAAIAFLAPSTDFGSVELDAISKYLENDGKLGKGLIVFADASTPYLTEFYDYLSQWGVMIDDQEGVVYEKLSSGALNGKNTDFYTNVTKDGEEILSADMTIVTGNNIPLKGGKGVGVTAKEIIGMETESGVIAPKGTTSDWSNANKVSGKAYASAVLSTKEDYDADNNLLTSHVMVFSSTKFVSQNYGVPLDNETVSILLTDHVTGRESSSMVFNSKQIDPALGQFTEIPTEEEIKTMRTIFMWVLPLLTLAVAVFIYIRRKNA